MKAVNTVYLPTAIVKFRQSEIYPSSMYSVQKYYIVSSF